MSTHEVILDLKIRVKNIIITNAAENVLSSYLQSFRADCSLMIWLLSE